MKELKDLKNLGHMRCCPDYEVEEDYEYHDRETGHSDVGNITIWIDMATYDSWKKEGDTEFDTYGEELKDYTNAKMEEENEEDWYVMQSVNWEDADPDAYANVGSEVILRFRFPVHRK